jgi:hypothetical protein
MSKLVRLDKEQLRSLRKVSVIGDLHGDYEALQWALSVANPAKDGIVFLGDYADRGPDGIEIIEAVDSLKRNHPQNVFALKGNHEDYTESGQPEFWPCTLIDEAQRKGVEWQRYFPEKFKPFIQSLPLAIVIPDETLFVHGGISTKIRNIGDLMNAHREVELDVLWSDPFEGVGEHPNWERGDAGVVFGRDVSERICTALGVKRIVRSHEPAKALTGPFYSHNGRVITVSTTSVYGGTPFLLNINSVVPSDFHFSKLISQDDASNPVL